MRILSAVFLLALSLSIFGQDIKENKTLRKARKHLSESNFVKAKEAYAKLVNADPKNSLYHFESGITYYNSFIDRDQALGHFENALQSSVEDTIAEIFYYLGKTNQYLGEYEKAITNYNTFTSFVKDNKEGSYVGGQVERFIRMCNNALDLEKNGEMASKDVTIKNLGGGVNSTYAEYGSITKKDESYILFTTRDRGNEGKKYYFDSKKHEDIYIAEMNDTAFGNRTKVDSSKKYFAHGINTKKHDAVISFSQNEDKLYIYQKNGLWVSELKNGKFQEPVELEELNTDGHEPSSFLTPDGKTLFFTSNKYNGMGGRDIFTSKLGDDGKWGTPVSLGGNVNTSGNEDAPFLTADGKTLFFSSTGHNSIGGYDIFKTELQENGTWGSPVNMGTVINSAADDIYYTQDSLGEVAYLSSGRAYGYGDMDIYGVSLMCQNIPNTEVRGLIVEGKNQDPIKATITAVNSEGENVGTFESDEKTGKYLMILPPDETYYLTVNSDKYGFLPRGFNDTIVLPRQCEYYQLFQHTQINEKFEDGELVAYEAEFDNVTYNIKDSVIKNYGVNDLSEILAKPLNQDSSYNLKGDIKHNRDLPAFELAVSLVDEDGSIVQRTTTANDGTYKFESLPNSEDYSILVDEPSLIESYYGVDDGNETSVIAIGELDYEKVDIDGIVMDVFPADSLEVILIGSEDDEIINNTFTNEEGEWTLDNVPTVAVNDDRVFVEELQMNDEDELFKLSLNNKDPEDIDEFTIITDLIDLPPNVTPPAEDISFEPIYFDFDKFFLRLASKEVLDNIYDYMKNNSDVNIEILGHTDWYGSDSYNIKLSKKRSKSAFDYLVSKGIDSSRLTMKWFGESDPAVPNANADGSDNKENRQLNRRCNFKIGDKETAYVVYLK